MAEYRYLACDLLTGRIKAELPMRDVNYETRVNDCGDFTGTVSITEWVKQDLQNSTAPVITALYVERDTALVWGGVLWGRQYRSGDTTIALTATEFLSYFDRRVIDASLVFTQIDQMAIQRSIIDYIQQDANSDIGITFPGADLSGVRRDRTYMAGELKFAGDAVRELSNVIDGCDFKFDVRWVQDPQHTDVRIPQKLFTQGYPRLGRAYADSKLVFEMDSNSDAYDFNESGGAMATHMYAVGATVTGNVAPNIKRATDNTDLQIGYPRLDVVHSYSDVLDLNTLAAHAKGDLAVQRLPVAQGSISVDGKDPQYGTFGIGDDFRWRVTDARFPARDHQRNGLDSTQRIAGIKVDVGENGVESISITRADVAYDAALMTVITP